MLKRSCAGVTARPTTVTVSQHCSIGCPAWRRCTQTGMGVQLRVVGSPQCQADWLSSKLPGDAAGPSEGLALGRGAAWTPVTAGSLPLECGWLASRSQYRLSPVESVRQSAPWSPHTAFARCELRILPGRTERGPGGRSVPVWAPPSPRGQVCPRVGSAFWGGGRSVHVWALPLPRGVSPHPRACTSLQRGVFA